MWFIFGWNRKSVKDYGPADSRVCNHCSNDRPWDLRRISTWVTVFFIPVVPYSVKNQLVCPICTSAIELDVEQFEKIRPLAENAKLLAEGKISEEEYRRRLAQKPTRRIEGWLRLVGFGLFLLVLLGIAAAYDDLSMFTRRGKEGLSAAPPIIAQIPGYRVALGVQLMGEMGLTLLACYLLYVLFRRNPKFPGLFVKFSILSIVYFLVDYAAFALLSGPTEDLQKAVNESLANIQANLTSTVVMAVVWGTYMLRSQRVRATFGECKTTRSSRAIENAPRDAPEGVRGLLAIANNAAEPPIRRLEAAQSLMRGGHAGSAAPVLRELARAIGNRGGEERLLAAITLGQHGKFEELKILASDPTVPPAIRDKAREAFQRMNGPGKVLDTDTIMTVLGTGGSARLVNAYVVDTTTPLYCTVCGWEGMLRNCQSEVSEGSMLTDYSCPQCDKMLIVEAWPTTEEALARGDPDAVAENNLMKRSEREKLKTPMELPEIEGSGLKFSLQLEIESSPQIGWLDHRPRYFIIECNGKVIWKEVALSGSLSRFHQLKKFLKLRYRSRFVSLTPSLDTIDWLVAGRPYWDYDKDRDPY